MDKKQSSALLGVTGTNFGIKTAQSVVIKSKEDFKTFKPSPSSILGQVRNFLPQIDKANKDLEKKVQSGLAADIDIENTDDCEGPVIELNLALFDQNNCSIDDYSSDSSSDSDSNSEAGGCSEVTETELDLKNSSLTKNLVEELQEGCLNTGLEKNNKKQ